MVSVKPKQRSRSVVLDPLKVRKLAASRGMNSLIAFEAAFLRYLQATPGVSSTIPSNAWKGRKVDKNRANELARFLGVTGHEALLPVSCPDLHYPESQQWDARYSPPGALLKAEYAAVPFHHRDEELKELHQWCLQGERLAVRMYTGAGGMGKTRLAIEHCQRMKRQYRWTTGFLKQRQLQLGEQPYVWLDKEKYLTPMLIVIDNAEARREETIALLKAALQAGNRVRVLLLSRTAYNWWQMLQTEEGQVGELLLSPATSRAVLQPFTLPTIEREEAYFLAADHFARLLRKDALLLLPKDIHAEHFDCVLLLHMQALIAVSGVKNSDGLQGILEVVLNRERRFWESQAALRYLPLALQQSLGLVMARITLMGGIKSRHEALSILESIPLLAETKRHERQLIVDLLHDIYPGMSADTGENKNYIEPLQPDLLGEHLIQDTLKRDADDIFNFLFS